MLSSEPRLTCQTRSGGRRRRSANREKEPVSGVLAVLVAFSAATSPTSIKLKDGSLIFARTKYTVKGDRAIITLENGTVTAIKLDEIDVEGSEKYNKENFGNVVAIDTPDSRKPTPSPERAAASAHPGLHQAEQAAHGAPPSAGREGHRGVGLRARPSAGRPEPPGAFTRVFDGAGHHAVQADELPRQDRRCSSRRTPRRPSSTPSTPRRARSRIPPAAAIRSRSPSCSRRPSGESAGTPRDDPRAGAPARQRPDHAPRTTSSRTSRSRRARPRSGARLVLHPRDRRQVVARVLAHRPLEAVGERDELAGGLVQEDPLDAVQREEDRRRQDGDGSLRAISCSQPSKPSSERPANREPEASRSLRRPQNFSRGLTRWTSTYSPIFMASSPFSRKAR